MLKGIKGKERGMRFVLGLLEDSSVRLPSGPCFKRGYYWKDWAFIEDLREILEASLTWNPSGNESENCGRQRGNVFISLPYANSSAITARKNFQARKERRKQLDASRYVHQSTTTPTSVLIWSASPNNSPRFDDINREPTGSSRARYKNSVYPRRAVFSRTRFDRGAEGRTDRV